jgi:hypothetical protein
MRREAVEAIVARIERHGLNACLQIAAVLVGFSAAVCVVAGDIESIARELSCFFGRTRGRYRWSWLRHDELWFCDAFACRSSFSCGDSWNMPRETLSAGLVKDGTGTVTLLKVTVLGPRGDLSALQGLRIGEHVVVSL